MTRAELAAKIDHTILNANATYDDIRSTILYAKEVGAASVCLNPAYVALAAELLRDTNTLVCTVIGFPLGANATYTKAIETQNAYRNGAREMDMVLNVSALKSGNFEYVKNDIEAVVNASPALVKVIIETCYLTRDEIVTACRLAEEAGAKFVKTSTGFGPAGAKAEDVALMRESVSANMQVKASGGIRTLKDVQAMLAAGASRIGMSRTAEVLGELDAQAAPAKQSTPAPKTAAQKSTPKKASPKTTKPAPASKASKTPAKEASVDKG